MSVSYPSKLLDIVFASSASGALVNNIPDTVAVGSALASYKYGFQAITMNPVTAGGTPPEGQDFNGVFQDLSSHIVWLNAGGQYRFSSAFSTLIGGYSAGMILQNNAGTASYISAVNNNTTDFNSTPSSIGSLWLPYSKGTEYALGLVTTGGTTVLTTVQAAAAIFTITGALTSNAIFTIPNGQVGKWIVENQTTGNFTVTFKTVSGTGVPILQNFNDCLFSDGTNINYQGFSSVTQTQGSNNQAIATTAYVDRAIADIGGYYVDTGATNAITITTVPVTIAYINGDTFRVKAGHTNTGACTFNAGPGAITLNRDDGAALQAGDIPVGTLINVTYVSSSNTFMLNSVVFSQFGTAAKLNASDQIGTVSATQCYGGNPNGFVAGNAGVIAGIAPSTCWDTVDQVLYTCVSTGTSSTAVWVTPVAANAANNAVLYQLGFAM